MIYWLFYLRILSVCSQDTHDTLPVIYWLFYLRILSLCSQDTHDTLRVIYWLFYLRIVSLIILSGLPWFKMASNNDHHRTSV